jgi:hypothetical protein
VRAEPVHERSEVPEEPRVTLAELRVQVNPVEGDTDDVRVTIPVNELMAITVIVDVPAARALTDTLVGLAVTEKSGTATL